MITLETLPPHKYESSFSDAELVAVRALLTRPNSGIVATGDDDKLMLVVEGRAALFDVDVQDAIAAVLQVDWIVIHKWIGAYEETLDSLGEAVFDNEEREYTFDDPAFGYEADRLRILLKQLQPKRFAREVNFYR